MSAINIMPPRRQSGQGMAASSLKQFLGNSYVKSANQAQNIDGFERDSSLSGNRAQVYHNKQTGKTIVSHTGTNSIQDWGTNAALAVGLGKYTKRYRHAKKIQDQAAAKYGNHTITTLGHSQSGHLGAMAGKDSHEIITFNKAANLGNIGHKVAANQHDIRTSADPVSVFSRFQKDNRTETIKSKTWNPLTEHSTEQLDALGDKYIGGRGLSANPWIAHVKAHAAKHGVSYRAAMSAAKATYKK